MLEKKRVYIIGNLTGSTRARLLLDFVSGSNKYSFSYDDTHFFKVNSKDLLKKAFLLLPNFLNSLSSFSKFLISDIIFILPMGKISFFKLKLAKLMNKKVVTEFYISKYDTYVNDKKRVDKNSKNALALKKFDQNIIDLSSDLIFLNNSEKEYYLDVVQRSNTTTKIHLIPLATESKMIAQLNYANLKTKKLILCWWGSYIPLHGLDKIIESAKYLKQSDISFEYHLFGTADKKAVSYQKMIDELELNDVVKIDNTKTFADKSLDKFLIENCDIAFGNFGDSEKAKVVMVNKAVEAVSMKIPVLSQKTKALGEYFENEETMFFCEPSPEEIAKNIFKISNNPELIKSVSKKGFSLYQKRFSKEAYIEDIQKILES
ncbi:glycosyltransferase [Halarcobacter sp.]|uniref:glycosyltransferase n=1 Tax=Halarcobacter sp. TaxID=2321133 RepID=UPI003A9089E1